MGDVIIVDFRFKEGYFSLSSKNMSFFKQKQAKQETPTFQHNKSTCKNCIKSYQQDMKLMKRCQAFDYNEGKMCLLPISEELTYCDRDHGVIQDMVF